MYVAMMALSSILRAWVKTPRKPIFLLNINHSSEDRKRPYSPEEITRMKRFLLENNWAGFIAIFCKDDDTGNHWQHAWPPQYRSRQLANPDCIQRKVLITPTGVDKN